MHVMHCKIARMVFGFGVGDLAGLAKVATGTVSRFEAGEKPEERSIDALQPALQSAGIAFLDGFYSGDGGFGVRLALPGDIIDTQESDVIQIRSF